MKPNQHRTILNQISAIRESHPEMENIFLKGSCLNFFCILRAVYPQAQPWFNIDHIITEIDGKFYDITGVVSNEGYMPFTQMYLKKRRIVKAVSNMKKDFHKSDCF